MLTRLEVDGFKNLLGFVAEFGPFTCVAGANAVGKSNLFDAIEFLSLLAQHKLNEAASKIRAVPGGSGAGRELFWTNGVERAETMSFAVEMIVDGVVFDELVNSPVEPRGRYLRYEIELGYENGQASLPRLVLVRERLVVLGDHRRIRFPQAPSFVDTQRLDNESEQLIFDTTSGFGFIEGRRQETKLAQRSVLSLPDATVERETTLAARNEMASWRRIALEPAAIAEPDVFGSPSQISTEGRHLPTTLRFLAGYTPIGIVNLDEDVYHDVALRLSAITPIKSIEVESDEDRGTRSLRVQLNSGEKVPARALSAGTLRFLALVVLARRDAGLICVEEPENGIHPFQIQELVEILRELATDPEGEFGPEDCGIPALRQVIINTHSPLLVQAVHANHPEDILLANTEMVFRGERGSANVMRLDPLSGTWRCHDRVRGVGRLWLAPYLGRMPNGDEP